MFDWIKNIFRKQDKPTLHMPSQDFKRRVEAAAVERAAARKVPSYRNPAPHASAPRSGPYGKPQPDTHIVDNGLSTLDYAVVSTVLSDTSYRSDSCSSSHESSPSSSYDSGSSSCDSGSSSSSD